VRRSEVPPSATASGHMSLSAPRVRLPLPGKQHQWVLGEGVTPSRERECLRLAPGSIVILPPTSTDADRSLIELVAPAAWGLGGQWLVWSSSCGRGCGDGSVGQLRGKALPAKHADRREGCQPGTVLALSSGAGSQSRATGGSWQSSHDGLSFGNLSEPWPPVRAMSAGLPAIATIRT